MERTLEELGEELNVELPQLVEHVKKLPKAQELEDLQAKTNCLLKENNEFKTLVTS